MFSFLDAMICTMGALLVLLHAFARHGQDTVTQKAEARANSAEVKAEREDLQWRIAHLKESRDKSAADLADQRLKLSHVEDHDRRLRDQFRNLKIAAEEMVRLGSSSAEEHQHAAAELQAAQENVLKAQLALDEVRKKAQGQASTYSVVPYEGPNATRRRPIYIECRADSVVLQPEGIKLGARDFVGPLGPGNTLASALRGMHEYLASQAAKPNQASEPYPLLLVRPDGIEAYYAARIALESWGSEFGYELVGADWKLKFPEPDPRLAELTGRVVAEARERQREYLLSLPQVVRRRNRPAYHANSRGGFSAQPGSGGGRGGGGIGDTDDIDWSGGGGNGSGGTDDGGYSGSSFSQGDGIAGGGTRNSPGGESSLGTGGAQPGGRSGALGSGGDGLDGTGQGLDVAVVGGELNGRGAGRYGDGTGASRYGNGTGGGGGPGDTSGQAGGSPEGRSADPGSRYGKGSDASGQDGSRTGGGGSSMAGKGAAGTRDGAEGQGFSPLPGGLAKNGSPQSGGSQQGSSQGGAASGGSSMGSDSAGNQASAGSAGSPGGSAQASGSPGTSAAGQAANVKSMAKTRGRDWGLPEAGVAAVAATRPIRVECHNDRLVIVPESRTELPKEVPLGARTQDSMDELVSDVWTHMKGWGVAGKGMYWRPTLVMEVKPGAADRYAEIKSLLADSGLDIHERRPPTAAKTPPPRKTTRK